MSSATAVRVFFGLIALAPILISSEIGGLADASRSTIQTEKTQIVINEPIPADGIGPAADEYVSWAIGDTHVHPPQPRLMCPAGKFVKSVWVRQNEWLARIKIYCAGASESFRPAGTKEVYEAQVQAAEAKQGPPFGVGTPGPEAGGNGGSGAHGYSIECPEGYLVDGITGLNTTVNRPYGNESFAADPHFFCGSYREPGAQVLSDSKFVRSGDRWVAYADMNSLYPDPGIQARFHCPPRWAATGMWYKLGGAKRDDIQTVGLICEPLPPPRSTTVVGP